MKLARTLVAVILLTVMSSATTVFACGPFALEAIFVYTVHPAYPLERFASGQIGMVQPTYARSYLFVAYRYLADSGFSENEQKELVALWKERIGFGGSLNEQDWIKAWTEARKRVADVGAPPEINVYRIREKPNEYESFLNCPKDAFEVAIQTMNDRVTKYGAQSPAIRSWVTAQDQVFSNCDEGKNIPPALDSSADSLARADRNYQIAAANFYAGNFDDAKTGFAAVAADNTSPWQAGAAYLVARTLVRKASLGPAETRDVSLSEAETVLKKISSDKKPERSHDASVRLADLVRLRLRPQERLRELAQSLVKPGANQSLKQQLWDYTILLDKFLENAEGDRISPPNDIRADDLTDWIATIQDGSEQSQSHSLEKWNQTHSVPWLINALSKLKGSHSSAPALIADATRVQPGSAAFASARFHAIRLLFESGKTVEAREQLDQLLKMPQANFDESTLNLLRSQRMMVSPTLSDFLTYAPRVPASVTVNDDGREIPENHPEELPDQSKSHAKTPLFDADAANAFNRQLPLSVLKVAATNTALPENLRRDLVQATWLRAVMLGNNRTAVEITPALKELVPGIVPLVDPFLAAPTDDAKRFTAIYAWLKFPGLEPVVDRGVPRDTLNEQDIYRDNWWCNAAFPVLNTPIVEDSTGAKPFVAPTEARVGFLSATEREAARKERSTLDGLGAAPNYICQQVIQWTTRTPNDPRVPEALHLAVRTTRYGCTDKESGRWSKAAFDLLHSKYPTSTWAKKTPYWFKD